MKEEHVGRGRKIVLILIVFAVFTAFALRLFDFQIVKGDVFRNQSTNNRQDVVTMPSARGEIYDRNGKPLVTNKIEYSIVFEKAYVFTSTQNSSILALLNMLKDLPESWEDTLPIVVNTQAQTIGQLIESKYDAEITFAEGKEKQIEALKKAMELQPYATASNCFEAMIKKYKLSDMPDIPVSQARTIAGIRYDMDRLEFSALNPYVFCRDVSMDTVSKIRENKANMPGVEIRRKSIRQYDNGIIAAHLIGQVGPIYQEEYAALKEKGYALNDIVGKDGIEKAMEDYLRGEDGQRTITRNMSGDIIDDSETKPAVAGNTVFLTIDADLQLAAQKALEEIIKDLQKNYAKGDGGDCQSGAIAVTDVKTGEILALATYPYYDITTYYSSYTDLVSDPAKPLINRAINASYEPGSTMKPSVALGALEEGTIDGNSTVYCKRVYDYFAPSYCPTCMGYHGSVEVTNALKKSCNYFFFDVGRRLGINKMNYYAKQLGLGQPTGIELPESTGILSSIEYVESLGRKWQPGNTIAAAIGQMDNLFTPLQLSVYAATIANNGVRNQAHLIKSVKSYDHKETIVPEYVNPLNTLTVSQENIDLVKLGMYKVANEPGGTVASVFGNYPVKIASKTGTSEVSQKGASNHSIFMSFAPYDEPEIAVSVVLENGATHSFDSNARTAKLVYDAYFALKNGELLNESSALAP